MNNQVVGIRGWQRRMRATRIPTADYEGNLKMVASKVLSIEGYIFETVVSAEKALDYMVALEINGATIEMEKTGYTVATLNTEIEFGWVHTIVRFWQGVEALDTYPKIQPQCWIPMPANV